MSLFEYIKDVVIKYLKEFDAYIMDTEYYAKRHQIKNIRKLTNAYKEKDISRINCSIFEMMFEVAPPWKFKRADQFLETYKFTDKELLDITGEQRVEDAKKIITIKVQEILDSGCYNIIEYFDVSRSLLN